MRIRLRERSWRFARPCSVSPAKILLHDLTLELDAVGSVLGHGLSSFESPAPRSIPKLDLSTPRGPLHFWMGPPDGVQAPAAAVPQSGGPDPGTPWGATCCDRDCALGMGKHKSDRPDQSSAFCDVIAVTKNHFMLGKTSNLTQPNSSPPAWPTANACSRAVCSQARGCAAELERAAAHADREAKRLAPAPQNVRTAVRG